MLPLDEEQARAAVRSLAEYLADRRQVAGAVEPKAFRKYDYLLSDELLTEALLRDRLDFDTAVRVAATMD